MRYASAQSFASGQARSRRIGRCARCHAPVLADEDHYGSGEAVVHGACAVQPLDQAGPAAAIAPPVDRTLAIQAARTARRLAACAGRHPRAAAVTRAS
jgi:hypothetical protein